MFSFIKAFSLYSKLGRDRTTIEKTQELLQQGSLLEDRHFVLFGLWMHRIVD